MNKKKLKRQLLQQKVTITNKDNLKMRRQAREYALKHFQPLASLALRDSEGFGEKRLLRFNKKMDEIYKALLEGRISEQDILDTLEEEVNIKFVEG